MKDSALWIAVFASTVACQGSSSSPVEGPGTPARPTPDAPSLPDAGDAPRSDPEPSANQADAGVEAPSEGPFAPSAPRLVRTILAGGQGQFVDGPQWIDKRTSLFFSIPLAVSTLGGGGKGVLASMKADGTNYVELRAGNTKTTGPVGSSVDADGNLITAELRVITRTVLGTSSMGAPTIVASGYSVAPSTPAVPFNAPNDLVALDDGTIYVTDPGYGMDPRPSTGFLYRIGKGQSIASVADSYFDNPSPNGIAVTKDQSTLYVSFTSPPLGTLPYLRKYMIGPDRSLSNAGKFAELPQDSQPDGMAVDESGNVYVAMRGGVAVFGPNGEAYGGLATVPQAKLDGDASSVAFGGADHQSLFVTMSNGKIFELRTTLRGCLP